MSEIDTNVIDQPQAEEQAPEQPAEPEAPKGTLTECPNGHSGLDIHRGINGKDQVENGILITFGYHCFRCGSVWQAKDLVTV